MKMFILLLVLVLSGCATVEDQVRRVTDYVCSMSPAEQAAAAERFDEITHPAEWRVKCGE